MSVPQTSWLKRKQEILVEPQWLKEGEKVELEYGKWEEVLSTRKNRKTGEEFKVSDFKLETTKGEFKFVNKQTFVAILTKFEDENPIQKGQKLEAYEASLKGKTTIYRRPITA